MAKRIIFTVFSIVFWISFSGFSQNDSIAKNDSLVQVYAAQKNRKELQEEQRALNFQKFFFEALTQKAIGNYDKAITALENCQNIRPNDIALNFEFSKNYFAQEKYLEAISFIQKALEEKPEDVFLLEHLKDIHVKQKNYKEALVIQQKIVVKNPASQADLIILYIRNNQIEDARNLLIDLEKKGILTENLMPFKDSLFPSNAIEVVETKTSIENKSVDQLKKMYADNKTFAILNQILIKQYQEKQYLELEKDGKEGLELFPAQPKVYLMYAKALNKLKKYKEAVTILQNGIDYVIDNYIVEADFYEELSLGYKGLSKNVDATKYYNMAVETRKKKSQ